MGLKAQVLAVNKLLSDIYKRDMRLSYLLAELDFCHEEIELINRKLLPNTVACFLNIIEKAIVELQDGAKQFKIMEDVYGLAGDLSKTLRQIGTELNISHERVRQLKKKIIRRLVFNQNNFSWKFEFEREIKQLLVNYRNCISLDIQNVSSAPKHNFNLSILSTGEKCLTISEGKNRIIIFESDFEKFHNNFIQQIKLLGWGNCKNNNIEEIRKKHSRAYEKWTAEEEGWLKNYLAEGLTISEIAEILERQPGAISSRIAKLCLC